MPDERASGLQPHLFLCFWICSPLVRESCTVSMIMCFIYSKILLTKRMDYFLPRVGLTGKVKLCLNGSSWEDTGGNLYLEFINFKEFFIMVVELGFGYFLFQGGRRR